MELPLTGFPLRRRFALTAVNNLIRHPAAIKRWFFNPDPSAAASLSWPQLPFVISHQILPQIGIGRGTRQAGRQEDRPIQLANIIITRVRSCDFQAENKNGHFHANSDRNGQWFGSCRQQNINNKKTNYNQLGVNNGPDGWRLAVSSQHQKRLINESLTWELLINFTGPTRYYSNQGEYETTGTVIIISRSRRRCRDPKSGNSPNGVSCGLVPY